MAVRSAAGSPLGGGTAKTPGWDCATTTTDRRRKKASRHAPLRICLMSSTPTSRDAVLLRDGHRLRPKRNTSWEISANFGARIHDGPWKLHLETPISVGDDIAKAVDGRMEPHPVDPYPLAAVQKHKGDVAGALAARGHRQGHIQVIVSAGSDGK